MIDSENWRRHTACGGMDPEIFFAEDDIPFAKAICGRCPDVCREFCLLEGFMLGDPGVRGGLSAHQRERLHGVHLRTTPTPSLGERRRNARLTEVDVPAEILVRTRQIRPEQLEWFLKLHDDGWTMLRISVLFKFAYTAVRRVIIRERGAA